tara:strand:- start:319 stop:474 length:156 start_codon:yes stop_codon:yes gene_type:complete
VYFILYNSRIESVWQKKKIYCTVKKNERVQGVLQNRRNNKNMMKLVEKIGR